MMLSKLFVELQRIGKALMLPVAVLPAAALALRLGAPDVFDVAFINAAGGAIFSELPLLFAIGIAIGIAKDEAGAAGLAGAIGYLSLTRAVKAFDESLNMGVFAGIIAGFMAGALYNRFHEIKLPDFLGFFSGKRFVPIATVFFSCVIACVCGVLWGYCQTAISILGTKLAEAGAVGAGVYGVLNRALLPFGLHHILNSYIFFIFGEYTTNTGVIATGELNRFFAGDPTAGFFLSGFYPVMMFGMPALALAIYHTTEKSKRKKIAGLMTSLALTSFLTGVTEPIEFLFMFVAPMLYALHAVLTGVSLAVAYALQIRQAFGFSAGLIDYCLSYGLASKPLLLIPLGLMVGVVYYAAFRFAIVKFNIQIMGKETEKAAPADNSDASDKHADLALNILEFLGGKENVKELGNCITRLRIEVKDGDKIKVDELQRLDKVKGVIKTGNAAQIIIGTEAEEVAVAVHKLR